MANRVRSTALIGAVAVIAVLLLVAQRGQAQTVASDRAAGYVVFPKIVVDSSDAFGQGRRVDTLIQLTNTSSSCRVVECFYVDATKHCSNGGVCRTNADCSPGATCGVASDCRGEHNFFLVLTPNQPVGWSANSGGVIPAEGECPGTLIPQTVNPVPEPFFLGELKCVEVDGTTPLDTTGRPIAANDLKGEATIEEVTAGTPGGVDVRAYNAIGIQSTAVGGTFINSCVGGTNQGGLCNVETDCPGGTCEAELCLGRSGPGSICALGPTNASCPATLVLNHFFEGAPVNGGLVTTDLTLVPCSENLAAPPGPSGVRPTTVQLLVYNEFEQRFSASTSVGCFKEIQLSNIDTLPGNSLASIFSVFVQGTLVGQTRIRPLVGSELDTGHGLLGIAEEFIGSAGPPFTRGSDAFNLNYIGTNQGVADVVILP